MTSTIFILVLAVTLAFVFGIIIGIGMERRRRIRDTSDLWMHEQLLGAPPPGPFDNTERW